MANVDDVVFGAVDHEGGRPDLPHPVHAGKGVAANGGGHVGKGDPEAGHEAWVDDDSGRAFFRRQVDGGNGADAVTVEDDVFRGGIVP